MNNFFASCSKKVLFHNESDPEPLRTLSPHSSEIIALDLNAKGTVAVSAGADGRIVITQVETATNLMSFGGGEGQTATQVAFSPSDSLLFGGFADGRAAIWDLKTRKIVMNHAFRFAETTAAAWLDDSFVISATSIGELALLDIRKGSSLVSQRIESGIRALAVHPTGQDCLVTACGDGSLQFFDCRTLKPLRTQVKPHSEKCTGVLFLPASQEIVVSCGADSRLVFTDLRERRSVKSVGFKAPLTALAASTTATTVLVGGLLGEVVGLDLRKATGAQTQYEGHTSGSVTRIVAPRLGLRRISKTATPRHEQSEQESYQAEEKLPSFHSEQRLKVNTLTSLAAKTRTSLPTQPEPSSLTEVQQPVSQQSQVAEEIKTFVREETNALRLDILMYFERQKEEFRALVREELNKFPR